jgi:O-antigen/teichoic acid export membrane protein
MIKKLRSTTYKLLRKSEKFFQTDMVYLAKGGFWLTLGQFFSSLSSFLLAIAFANLLPKEVYGTYKYVLSLVGMLSIFTLSGMNTSLTRAVARGFEGDLKSVLKEKIKWGSIGSLISLGIAIYYYLNGNLTLTICFVMATVFLPLMDPLGIYISFLNGRKNFKLATKYHIITQIIATILMILVLIFSKNIFLILFSYFISYTSLRFIFLKLTFKNLKPNLEKEPGTISYGKHLSLMNVIGLIASQIDKILVWHFIGPAELAIYSIAIAPPEQIKGLLKNINTLALPKFSQKTIPEIKKNIYQKMKKLFLFLILIVGIYWVSAPLIFKVFFPQYLESIFYSQIFSIGLLLFAFINLSDAYLRSQKKQKELYKVNIYSSVIQIFLLIIFIYFFGLWGIIFARILYRLFFSILYFYTTNKQ